MIVAYRSENSKDVSDLSRAARGGRARWGIRAAIYLQDVLEDSSRNRGRARRAPSGGRRRNGKAARRQGDKTAMYAIVYWRNRTGYVQSSGVWCVVYGGCTGTVMWGV